MTERTAAARHRLVPIQYLALALVWGSSFLFMKVALDGLSPAQVVLGRLVLGALALVAVMALTGRRWPRDAATWGHLSVIAVFMCALPFSLFAWAGQHIPSGLSSIYNATTPLMTVLIGVVALPQERLTRTRALGIALGAAGVLVVVGPWELMADPAFGSSVPAQLACLGATACYGVAITYTRRFVATRSHDAPTIAATQVSIAAALMLLLSPFLARGPVELSPAVVASMLALGVLGTGVAYVWNTVVIKAWGATPASTVTYLTPVVGVTLGAVVLGESFGWNEGLGAVVVVLGILIAQGRLRLPERGGTPTASPEDPARAAGRPAGG